ncbi:MAG: transcriptional regulator CynR [Acidiferrobacteraceae bacterium]|nr:transcriptional regulator CynR [Acidiferrobacteraceae bacterium]|tara:strand:- start:197 stop:1105 length:909 start_codon:yes stop_codon:yes gene_type:complete
MDRNVVFPKALKYLVAVAEHKSFTKAADALYISQPTLSQQIKRLEDSLEVLLLDRTRRSIKLTDAGEVYLSYARTALVELDAATRAIDELSELRRGTIRLGMTPITDFMISSLLDTFNKKYPNIVITALEMAQDNIESALTNDELDIGIGFSDNILSTKSDDLDAQMLLSDSISIAVGNQHPLANNKSAEILPTLASESLVMLNKNFELRRHADRYFHENNITPTISIEANSLGVIIEMVRIGRLVTILPQSIIASQSGISALPSDSELFQHTVTLISRKEVYKSTACNAFIQSSKNWKPSV